MFFFFVFFLQARPAVRRKQWNNMTITIVCLLCGGLIPFEWAANGCSLGSRSEMYNFVITSHGGIKGAGLCHYSEGPFLTLIILPQSLNCPKPVCAFSRCTLLDWYTQSGRLRTFQMCLLCFQLETFTCFCARLEKGRLYLLHWCVLGRSHSVLYLLRLNCRLLASHSPMFKFVSSDWLNSFEMFCWNKSVMR